ncbi:MAG: ABC transporter permease [Bacteroidales bacterium]|nr:ABC transporter permease [Bacteroidales bacterium]
MAISLLEVPFLALILGFISKYSEQGVYSFGANKNYPVFLFMAIIVALFVGLTVSAEEIFRDRKILEREKFLHISRSSYLFSKIAFLFFISAIQSLSFVIVANLLLEVKGMHFQQWLVLFSIACFGNVLGLNISAGMRTAVSIYILIPLLLVPMLLLGGAMIKFDDLHKSLSKNIYVPVIGDAMATRWAYEALMVDQFKSNRWEKPLFEYDMEISQTGWYNAFLIPTLRMKIDECRRITGDPKFEELCRNNLKTLRYHLDELEEETGVEAGSWILDLNIKDFSALTGDHAKAYLDSLTGVIRSRNRRFSDMKDELTRSLVAEMGSEKYQALKEANYNENVANFVLNRLSMNKINDVEKRLIQKADPVFQKPGSKYGRAHFYAPYKLIGNLRIDTLFFNVIAIWIMTGTLFVTLYFNVLKRFIEFLETLKIPIWRQFGRELLQR